MTLAMGTHACEPAVARSVDDIAVSLRGVGKDYGAVTALGSIDLDIRKGEFFSLLGPSGCGKTTTLGLIGGFEAASRGTVSIDGRPMDGVPSHRRQVNTVFQNYALFPHMTVGENVAFGLKMKKVPAAERSTRVDEMLRLVSLDGYERRHPQQLSGGQRQRVALARALINHPSVLLLDEPLGALDLKLRKQMQTELTRLQRQVGITFVYVTHDQEEALSMSDRIAVMDHGKVLQVGTPAEIYDHPAERFVMEFIGTPNALRGRAARADGNSVEVAIDGEAPVRGRTVRPIEPDADVDLLVRPERTVMSAGRRANGAASLTAEITRITNVGFVTHYFLRLRNGQELVAYRLNDPASNDGLSLAVGAAVQVGWEEINGRVFPAGAAS